MPPRTVLMLSNSQDATADYLCGRLSDACVAHRRFDTDIDLTSVRLVFRHGELYLRWAGEALRSDQITTIIYRRPKPFKAPVTGDGHQHDHASEEWAEAVEGFLAHVAPSDWINHPSMNFNASHKIEQLTRARSLGLTVPAWIVTTVAEEAAAFLDAHDADVIAKPLSSGYIERDSAKADSLIYTCAIDRSHLDLFPRLVGCPVLFQERVRKQTDVRLIVVDGAMTAVALTARDATGEQRLDIRRDNMHDVAHEPIAIPTDVRCGVNAMMSFFRLRFAAVDFAVAADGRWVFFEVNPNGQWAWLDLCNASDVGQLFIDAVRRRDPGP